jgi:hypothetical protein
MKIEEIHEEWAKDGKFDLSELGYEATNKKHDLHTKYTRLVAAERLLLKTIRAQLEALTLEKWEFYTQGPTKEQSEKGWKLPAKGLILKQEVDRYMKGDPDLIRVHLKIGIQMEKIDVLESIIKCIHERNYGCNVALRDMLHKAGVGA